MYGLKGMHIYRSKIQDEGFFSLSFFLSFFFLLVLVLALAFGFLLYSFINLSRYLIYIHLSGPNELAFIQLVPHFILSLDPPNPRIPESKHAAWVNDSRLNFLSTRCICCYSSLFASPPPPLPLVSLAVQHPHRHLHPHPHRHPHLHLHLQPHPHPHQPSHKSP